MQIVSQELRFTVKLQDRAAQWRAKRALRGSPRLATGTYY